MRTPFGRSCITDNPPTPRQLLHGRHPLYPVILGIQEGLIPTMGSAAPKPTPPTPPQPPVQKQPDNAAMCAAQYSKCQQLSTARSLKCAKAVTSGALALGVGCFPICAGSGPAAPACVAACEEATGARQLVEPSQFVAASVWVELYSVLSNIPSV
jgi:hypothetical protein